MQGSHSGVDASADARKPVDRARERERTENRIFLLRVLLTIFIALVYHASRLSHVLAEGLRGAFESVWIIHGLYVLISVFGFATFLFPLSLYEEYVLEKAYGRSRQTLGEWFADYLKSLVLELVLAVAFFEVLYALLRWLPNLWWLATASFYIGAVIVFSSIAPVWILPLFYSTEPAPASPWVDRIREILRKMGLPDLPIFIWRLSSRTNVENAALVGMGRTRRILVADNLVRRHSDDEIVALVAHEIGHYKNHDLWRAIWAESAVAVGSFYVAHRFMIYWVPRLGFAAASDIETFPLLVLCLFVVTLIVMPLVNTLSRCREFQADAFAVRALGTAKPLIEALEKIADENVSDPEPPAVIEFLLHSHPSIVRRKRHAIEVERQLRGHSDMPLDRTGTDRGRTPIACV